MASPATIALILVLLHSFRIEAEEIKSARLLDLMIRDYTFKSYTKNFRTGKLHKINLPSNLSGIHVDTVRLRCGSLRRYGATIKEFELSAGTYARPCSKRILIIRQKLGSNWSSLYYSNYELSGYELISPVLGLLAYNIGAAAEIRLQAGMRPIRIDFSGVAEGNGMIPMCARFEEDGRVSVWRQPRANVCVATGQGHFGVVVEAPLVPLRRRAGKWRMAVGGAIGAGVGVLLLSLLGVAVVVKAKKKERMEEMERRAYEEEALQVSMVGHVRAVTASGTRTMPTIHHHHDSRPPHRSSSS
ncbi:hypothetical protein SASPL_121038 [Salvia splendens]|uniref:Uncharacterized protein n=1 Tax=Salvia splendens TaxID=180675 RepID=A0A8X8ZUF6_SALSN|nr:uncharacterized protein LOC121741016 [Salvia splendens]KAG6418832.1 hypothetical protein SASPL_121038 [Salvia splendens]